MVNTTNNNKNNNNNNNNKMIKNKSKKSNQRNIWTSIIKWHVHIVDHITCHRHGPKFACDSIHHILSCVEPHRGTVDVHTNSKYWTAENIFWNIAYTNMIMLIQLYTKVCSIVISILNSCKLCRYVDHCCLRHRCWC